MFYQKLRAAIFVLQINYLLGDPIIQLPNGQIQGREATTIENKSYYAFEGIPYAAPPIGELRFQPPQPPASWDGVLETTWCYTMCFQRGQDNEYESEDCLFINVYTPQLPNGGNNVSLPVMLFIHGGGFVDGTGTRPGPDLFLNNDVVFATINYRLGVFGFISTQDEVIPGNNGLKDQRLALQWTHDNIHLFGGNPDKVTIIGVSAGSASCAYQLLNQNSNGLFHGAILQSGSFLSPWAYERNAREIAFITGSILNPTFANSNDSQALLDYLLTVDARDLDRAAQQHYNYSYGYGNIEINQGFYWAPVIEVDNPDAFITQRMYGLLQAGNVLSVPILIGTTSEEILPFYPDKNEFRSIMAAYDENLSYLVPHDMLISDEAKLTEMGGLIRNLYTGGEPFADHLDDGIRYSGDTAFSRSIIKQAEIFSKISATYFYIFSYDGKMGEGNPHFEGAEGVGHGEESNYLFCGGTGCDGSQFPEADTVTRQRLAKMWSDFAKYQNPTPEPSELLQSVTWPAVYTNDGDFYYLDINENLEVKNHPKESTYSNWVALYESLGYSDFDTY